MVVKVAHFHKCSRPQWVKPSHSKMGYVGGDLGPNSVIGPFFGIRISIRKLRWSSDHLIITLVRVHLYIHMTPALLIWNTFRRITVFCASVSVCVCLFGHFMEVHWSIHLSIQLLDSHLLMHEICKFHIQTHESIDHNIFWLCAKVCYTQSCTGILL